MITAIVTAAGMTAAIVTFTVVVVVIAVKIFTHFQCAVDKGLGNFTHIALCTADDQNESSFESIDSAAADAAANQHIYFFFSQQSGQSAVAGIAGRKFFLTDDLPVFSFKDSKSGCMTEMLKDLIIFTSNCNFHISPLFYNFIVFT
jgi:hypothetical protein